MTTEHERLRAALRDVPDFPKPGILFKDITPLLGDPALFRLATTLMAQAWTGKGITHVAAIESRGFILGGPVAQAIGAGLVPIRKPGKLPAKVARLEYVLEYGSDVLEVHADSCGEQSRVLVVDDVLATGGTAAAACALIEQVGGSVIGCQFLLEIPGLGGRDRLGRNEVESVL